MFQILLEYANHNIVQNSARAVGTLMVAWFVGKIVQRALTRYVKPKTHSPGLVDVLGKVVKNILLILALVSALGTFGVNVQGLVAGLGLTGFAAGFALKDALANMIAGTFILLYQPFKAGQYIRIVSSKSVVDEGTVKKVDLRYTTLDTDEQITLVPNSILFTTTISIVKKPTAQQPSS